MTEPRRGGSALFGVLFVGIVLLVAGLAGGTMLARLGAPGADAPSEETMLTLLELQATRDARPSPKPTFTQPAAALPTAPLPTPAEAIGGALAPPPQPVSVADAPPPVEPTSNASEQSQVTFNVQVPQLPLYQGPGEWYGAIGAVGAGTSLYVSGRTADGDWWLVCCDTGRNGWMRLDGTNVLAYGDVNSLSIYSVPSPPTPIAPPAPPPPAALGAAGDALVVVPGSGPPPPPLPTPVPPTAIPTPTRVLPPPIQGNPACAVAGASYSTLPILGAPALRPPSQDPEMNIALRGWDRSNHHAFSLWDYPGDIDPLAPRFQTLFSTPREPRITGLFRVRTWNWESNSPGGPIEDPNVTLIQIATDMGEPLFVADRPDEGEIGGGYKVLVLFADADSLTLKYTREDNILFGYAIHIEGFCVEPTLLALYQQQDRAGRSELPALRGLQPIGRAMNGSFLLAIRDTGSFLDPRVEKDWWQGLR